jgi:pyruvate kinase
MINKKTKVVCTLGPASSNKSTLEKMIKAGMNVARLNFSHGEYKDFERIIKTIRQISKKLGIPVAIMQDLQGPKIRTGRLPAKGVQLKQGSTIEITWEDIMGSSSLIPIPQKKLLQLLKKDDLIMLVDGMVQLKVLKPGSKRVKCSVEFGGEVQSRKGVNFPTLSPKISSITEKDKEDLAFGLKHDVDYVALSFVQNAKDIEQLRNLIRKHKGQAKILAKIEHHDAINNIDEIIRESDAVMVARGDLGVEISPEKVPEIQKKIILKANLQGIPVITATEILLSMVENSRPTRAEVSDAANAIYDHTDAVMLSNESAVGEYPVEATLTLSKIAAETENTLKSTEKFVPNKLFIEGQPISESLCYTGAEMAMKINAKYIVAITKSGFTAQQVAKHRVYIPIIAITDTEKVQRQLQMVWGVDKTFVKKNLNIFAPIRQVHKLLLEKGLVKKGDRVVIIANATSQEKLISTIAI